MPQKEIDKLKNYKTNSQSAIEANVTSKGVTLEVNAENPAFLATPLNISLRPKAYINGVETKIWNVNGTFSGIILNKGKQKVEFTIPHDFYAFIVYSQLALYFILGAFFLMARRKD
ncbi:MAG: YfhO family protein [Ignavibacteriales bacterium]|nr:YfhO family protein [Ignavibacteriales bacterium]